MDIFNNLLEVYNSSSKNITKKYEEKKNDILNGIGNLNTTTFYSIIAFIIVLSILLPLAFLYYYNQSLINSIFLPETSESNFIDDSSETLKETIKDTNEIIKDVTNTNYSSQNIIKD